MTTTQLQGQARARARAAYRAVLRELPRHHPRRDGPSPLHLRIRTAFRENANPTSSSSTSPAPSTVSSHALQHQQLRVQEAEQLALYARAQRMYAALLERYNPGINLNEEERVRLTARRVGLDLPVEAEQKESGLDAGDGRGEGERDGGDGKR